MTPKEFLNPPKGGSSQPLKPRVKFSGSAGRYGKRHKPGTMNRTEEAYAAILEDRKRAGEIVEWHFEAVTFKLAEGSRYTSDFLVLLPSGEIEFVDTKGGGPIDRASPVRMKVAAEKFFMFRFVIEQKLSKKDALAHGSNWKRVEF